MGKAYRIKRYDHVTPAKRRRLLEEDLVPILDQPAENAPDVRHLLSEGDWLVEYRDKTKPIYIYKVKTYRYKPHLHLYVKHYAESNNVYQLGSEYFSDNTHLLLSEAKHLESLPEYLYDAADNYYSQLDSNLDERVKQLILKLKRKRNILTPFGRDILTELENGRLTFERFKQAISYVSPNIIDAVRQDFPEYTDAEWTETHIPRLKVMQWEYREKNMFDIQSYNKVMVKKRSKTTTPVPPLVEYVDPSKITGAISKAALESYMKQHNGQLPTVKEFEKLTKRFMTPGTRLRRSNDA